MKIEHFKYLIILLLFLYFFIVFKPSFRGPEEPLYFAYTVSVIEDSDLNIVNNIDPAHSYYFPSGKTGISKTYNFPDYHNHGGVIFWIPAYFYGKFSYFLMQKITIPGVGEYSISDFINCTLSFSSVFFAFLTLLLSYFFCRQFFSTQVSFWSVLAIFFGTPFFVFALLETGNANMLAALLSTLLIWFGSYMANMKKRDLFLFGLFFSLCLTVKSELAFQVIFIFLFFISLVFSKQHKLLSAGYFIAGFIPGYILRSVNDILKYGTVHIGELSLFNIKNWYFFEQLFSSYRGFFYTSPVLYICILGLIFSLKCFFKKRAGESINDSTDRFLLILSSYLIIKILVLSFRFAWGGGTPGARILSAEFLIFVLLFARAAQISKYLKPVLITCALVSIAWNFIMIYEYSIGVDMKNSLLPPAPAIRVQELRNILGWLLSASDLGVKFRIGLPLFLLATSTVFFTSRNIKQAPLNFWPAKKERPSKLFTILAILATSLFLTYSLITVLNVLNNRKNVLRLQEQGFFKNSEILSKREFEKLENIGSMNEMIEYFQARGDSKKVRQLEIYKNQFYGGTDNVR